MLCVDFDFIIFCLLHFSIYSNNFFYIFVLYLYDVDNCDTTECNLLTILNNDINILNKKDIGKKYFSCSDINNPRLYIKNLVIKNID